MATDTTLAAAANVIDSKVEDVKVDATKVADATKPDPAAEKLAGEKAAAELAAKPFTDAAQLKLPDGMKLDESMLKDFLPLAKEAGLTAAQAQKLVEFNAAIGAKVEAAKLAAQETASKAAVEALKGDKDIGGSNWSASQAFVAKALKEIGSPELNKALNELQLADGSMLGDNLVMAKLLVNLGKRVSEDSTKGSHTNQKETAANSEAAFLKSLYGDKPGNLKFG